MTTARTDEQYIVTYNATLERQAVLAQQRMPEPETPIYNPPRKSLSVPTVRRWSTRGRVLDLLKAHGWMTVKQMTAASDLTESQVWNAVSTLCHEGKVLRKSETWRRGHQQYRAR